MARLVLASQSPRRREFLSALGIPFLVVPSRSDETLPPDLPLSSALEAVAFRKAHEVAATREPDQWVLAADTAVVIDGRAFGKPRGREQAAEMLRILSGRVHRVVTAVALVGPVAPRGAVVTTEVTFAALSDPQIRWYTSLEEPYDKAGGYAIQGAGGCLVESIRGSYTNVVGLPMAETVRLLEAAGLAPWPQAPGHGADG